MKRVQCVVGAFLLMFAINLNAQESGGAVKTIAIGDVDAGYSMSGQKAYDVKETIQILLKKDLEKIGKGNYVVKITSPAVVTEGQKAPEASFPTLPEGKQPTQKDMAKYMAQMQQWQKQMTGEVKVHKPVAADAYVDLAVRSGQSSVDTGGAMSTVSQFTGVYTSAGDVSTKSTKVDLVCTLRDPATGELQDRYVAKASSVKFRNIAGVTSYDYGDDSITQEKLFKSAVQKCAKWIAQQVK